MRNKNTWQLLQLFSCENAATAPGENAADAGQRLRELGIPEEKIPKHRARQEATLPEGAIRAEGQAAADAEPQNRLTWEQIVKDPEYNAQLQKEKENRNSALHKSIKGLRKGNFFFFLLSEHFVENNSNSTI